MEKAIDILEMEIDSMKDAYKQDDRDACKREYAERILSCKKAIKLLKLTRLKFYKDEEPIPFFEFVLKTKNDKLFATDKIPFDTVNNYVHDYIEYLMRFNVLQRLSV